MQNEAKTLKVSDKGQIAIPNQIRERLGINRGDTLIIFEIDGKILIEKMNMFSKKLQDDFGDIQKLTAHSLNSVWDNTEDEVWEQYL